MEEGYGYPKHIDFDVEDMKKYNLKMLGICFVLCVLMVAASIVLGDTNIPYLKLSVGAFVVVLFMFFVFLYNTRRAVKTVTIEQDGFYVNEDFFAVDDVVKVSIAPVLPLAGQADNFYLKVKTSKGNKKYWAGVNGDPKASALRDKVRSELIRLSPTLVK